MTSEPVLQQPDIARPFIIETDASEWAIGCSLLQLGAGNGKSYPIAYDGRKLTGAELNYPVHEKELLAIKHALRTWYMYIDNGKPTVILTDHESLKYLKTTKNPSKRLARWISEFSEYDLDIKYRKGSEAIVPDAISRRPDLIGTTPGNRAVALNALYLTDPRIRFEDEDSWHTAMIQYLCNGTEPSPRQKKDVCNVADQFQLLEDGDLLCKVPEGTALYLAYQFRVNFLEHMHTEYGHLGYPGLLGVVRPRAWWHTLESDIRKFTNYCPQCQTAQRQRPGQEREPPQHLVESTLQPFERWGIDLIGILPVTPNGNRWIITGVDYATGWPVARATKDALAITIAWFIYEVIFMNYGPPREILTDNGANLDADVIDHYMQILSTTHRHTTPYHPRTNGKVENLNGTLRAMLTKYLMNQPTKLWDLYLPQALFATRIRAHATSKYSPFYLLYGRHPYLPSDDNPPRPMEVSITLEQHEDRIKKLHHVRIAANELLLTRAIAARKVRSDLVKASSLKPGTWVLIRHEGPQKFEAKWYGPYKVLQRHILGTYRLADPSGRVLKNLVNGQRLINAHLRDDNVDSLWSDSKKQADFRRINIEVEKTSPEILEILDQMEPTPPTYNDLATMSRKEWQNTERAGARKPLVGEGQTETNQSRNPTGKIRSSAQPKRQASIMPPKETTISEENAPTVKPMVVPPVTMSNPIATATTDVPIVGATSLPDSEDALPSEGVKDLQMSTEVDSHTERELTPSVMRMQPEHGLTPLPGKETIPTPISPQSGPSEHTSAMARPRDTAANDELPIPAKSIEPAEPRDRSNAKYSFRKRPAPKKLF